MTGLQEIQKFQKHLIKCKKNPNRKTVKRGYDETTIVTNVSMADALRIRAESGQ